MLITLIIILLLIGAAVISSIYSNFVVFYSNFFESENYHKAYYASISALERGELVTKQRAPGYMGSGGFIMGEGTGTEGREDNFQGDASLSGFSYLGDDSDESSVFWTVNSRTTRIPAISGGDVEWMLSADDSPNYNMMGYENSEVFLLYYDNSQGNPYSTEAASESYTDSKPQSITGIIRLPAQLNSLSGGYGPLDTSNSLVGKVGDLPNDDAIVDRQIRGQFKRGPKYPFIVYSTQSTVRSNINYGHDSVFRESDINSPLNFRFGFPESLDSRDPIVGDSNGHGDRIKNIINISEVDDALNELQGFRNLFEHTSISEKSFRFSLLNLLKSTNSGQYYPFLEYYADFGTDVSDKYYTIDGEGNYKDFQVNTIIQKPTVKETVLGNFTSIF